MRDAIVETHRPGAKEASAVSIVADTDAAVRAEPARDEPANLHRERPFPVPPLSTAPFLFSTSKHQRPEVSGEGKELWVERRRAVGKLCSDFVLRDQRRAECVLKSFTCAADR